MKKLLALFILLFSVMATYAQVITMGQGTVTTYTGCVFTIYDDGGLNGDYSANQDYYVTIYSNDPSNAAVSVEIQLNGFNVHPSDTLYIYDGTVMADSLLLAKLNDSLVALVSAPTIKYAATISNSSGALTLRFKSDGSGGGEGWSILSTCEAPCQRINVKFDTLLSNKYPRLEDDGFYYITMCPGEILHLVAYGEYPDNNFSYNQNDQTSIFHWDLGVEEIDSVGYSTLEYEFPGGRGYDVSLMISDSAECYSHIPQVFRVKTSANPIASLIPLPPACTGDSLNLIAGYDQVSNLQLDTVQSLQATTLAVSDTIFLPDGQECGNGCSYSSPVTFTAFAPSATIQSANDILYVRLSIEHSYIGDVWIRLSCPNGQYVSLMRKYGSSGSSSCASVIPASEYGWLGSYGTSAAYFGLYYEPDGSVCNPAANPMGTCWNYCWSNATNQGYQYACGASHVYESCNHINGSYVDSTNTVAMTNVYHPDGAFTNLIGCPMNGMWSIEVVDAWGSDNGYICGWELALDPSLMPADWSYQIVVDTTYLYGPGANGTEIVPDTAGTLNYTLYVVDDAGCVFDTIMPLEVHQSPLPDLGEDLMICHGDMITLDAHYSDPNASYVWNTGDNTETINVLTDGDYVLNVTSDYSTSTTNLMCTGNDTIHVGVYESPQINYSHSAIEGCAPLTVHINNQSTPTNADFEWMVFYSNGAMAMSSHQINPTFEIEEPGHYTLYLKVTTQDGCVDSLIRWDYIRVNAQPIAEFAATPEISLMSENDGQVVFTNYSDENVMTQPGSSFYWDFDDGEVDSSTIAPTHVFAQWGDYNVTLHIETEDGCASEIAHTVVIEQDLIFPNVITPNGDGINDVFAIENLNTNVNLEDPDEYRTNKLYIYDRWGKKVYSAKNYDTFSLNGQITLGNQFFDGSSLSDGVYYFSFYYKGKAKTVNYNGSLTIIR
jgi:gliding motility-associated-like protein